MANYDLTLNIIVALKSSFFALNQCINKGLIFTYSKYV